MPNTHGVHLHCNILVKAGLPSTHFSITRSFWFLVLTLNKDPPPYHFIPWPYFYPRVPSKELSLGWEYSSIRRELIWLSRVWCCVPAIPILGRQKQEGQKFRVYVKSVLVWVAWEPVSKEPKPVLCKWGVTGVYISERQQSELCTDLHIVGYSQTNLPRSTVSHVRDLEIAAFM